MKYSSRAIALSYIKHGESAIIAKVFTEEKGLQGFIIKGVRSDKSKKKLGLFQALQLSNINATYFPNKSLQYLTDISLLNSQMQEGINMKKNFLSLFIAEITSKILHENEVDKPLFQFIWNLKNALASSDKIDPNFPIIFMIDLSKYMGFYPLNKEENSPYFNLELGEFTNSTEQLNYYINQKNSHYFKALLNKQKITIPYANRNQLLLDLINYYKLQHHELKNMTSHLIIESLRV
ncbi:MAG: DNA repair protein RecO [Pelagibacterales bacterium]|nr:DNA repair protein RecO [Pelagibacterales bacterium]